MNVRARWNPAAARANRPACFSSIGHQCSTRVPAGPGVLRLPYPPEGVESAPIMSEPRADIFQKCHNYTRYKEAVASGLYPYFKAIESGADAEVMIKGKRMIMIGSNNYLGLTTHPKVKEAGIK